jgi:hypothetical protein
MTAIEAQEQLKMFEVQDWGQMKKQTREKRHKELFAKAYPGEMKPKNYVSAEHVQRLLGGLNGR